MGEFVERYILVPDHQRYCSECHALMPALTAIAPLARLAGWSFYADRWFCGAHAPSRNPAIRKRIDDKQAEILAKAAAEAARWRAEADRELIRRMGHAPPPQPLQSPKAETVSAASTSATFGQVLVVAEESAFPFAEDSSRSCCTRSNSNRGTRSRRAPGSPPCGSLRFRRRPAKVSSRSSGRCGQDLTVVEDAGRESSIRRRSA